MRNDGRNCNHSIRLIPVCIFFFIKMEEGQIGRILAQFKSENGELVASPFDLPLDTSAEKLQLVCQALLPEV